MAEDLSEFLTGLGLVPDTTPRAKWLAEVPAERAKARLNYWQNRYFSLNILAADREHWYVEMGVEILYFPDNSIHITIPHLPDLANGITMGYYFWPRIEALFKSIIETYRRLDEVAKDAPMSFVPIVPDMFISYSGRETNLNADLSRAKGSDCLSHPELEVFQMSPEELRLTAELLGLTECQS